MLSVYKIWAKQFTPFLRGTPPPPFASFWLSLSLSVSLSNSSSLALFSLIISRNWRRGKTFASFLPTVVEPFPMSYHLMNCTTTTISPQHCMAYIFINISANISICLCVFTDAGKCFELDFYLYVLPYPVVISRHSGVCNDRLASILLTLQGIRWHNNCCLPFFHLFRSTLLYAHNYKSQQTATVCVCWPKIKHLWRQPCGNCCPEWPPLTGSLSLFRSRFLWQKDAQSRRQLTHSEKSFEFCRPLCFTFPFRAGKRSGRKKRRERQEEWETKRLTEREGDMSHLFALLE